MIPLNMIVGSWADYSTVTLTGGRRSEDLVRIQCVGRAQEAPARGWVVELLPLQEVDGTLAVIPGEGLSLQISQEILRREADLVDVIQKVVRWQDGEPRELSPAEWREDPLVEASLVREFQPESVEFLGGAVRVVRGQELACDQFQMTAADTQAIELPAGRLEQVTRWEVTAAISAHIPFLGIAFAAERTRAESHLDPPSERFEPPPPATRVETLELIAYGNRATPQLVSR